MRSQVTILNNDGFATFGTHPPELFSPSNIVASTNKFSPLVLFVKHSIVSIDYPFNIAKKLIELLYFREVSVKQDEKAMLLDAINALKISGTGEEKENEMMKPPMTDGMCNAFVSRFSYTLKFECFQEMIFNLLKPVKIHNFYSLRVQ